MRLFIALPFSPAMKQELVSLQTQMKEAGVQGNFTRENNLHITLLFLGEVPDPNPVMQVLSSLDFNAFHLSLGGWGHFKNLYYAEIRADEALHAYVAALKTALKENGIPFDDKPFFPHATLVRKAVLPQGFSLSVKGMTFQIDRVVLYRSSSTDGRLIYTPLFTKFYDQE